MDCIWQKTASADCPEGWVWYPKGTNDYDFYKATPGIPSPVTTTTTTTPSSCDESLTGNGADYRPARPALLTALTARSGLRSIRMTTTSPRRTTPTQASATTTTAGIPMGSPKFGATLIR